MNSKLVFCKKFKLPYKRISTYVCGKRFINKIIDYDKIIIPEIELSSFSKKGFCIFKIILDKSIGYIYSNTFNSLYKVFSDKERLDIVYDLQIIKDNIVNNGKTKIVIKITLPYKQYSILDWGRIIIKKEENDI